MDVVDTLRHRERLVARELDSEGRERELVRRLKEIYAAQGIAVPDRILREGVQSLEENRFAYRRRGGALFRMLANLWIRRVAVLKGLAITLAVLAVWIGADELLVDRPAEARLAAERQLFAQDLPDALAGAYRDATDQIDAPGLERANAYLSLGEDGLEERDETRVRQAIVELEQLDEVLDAQFQVRVVYTRGRLSGVYRLNDANADVTNYYLIVEAVGPDGALVDVPVTSEETGNTAYVESWGQRVTQDLFDRVAADKQDDAIIQDAVIGAKAPGQLRADFMGGVQNGAILEWGD